METVQKQPLFGVKKIIIAPVRYFLNRKA